MDVSSPSQQGLLALIRRHPLSCYFFLAYLLSWLGWLPLVLSRNGLGFFPFHAPSTALLGGALGPIGSGFLLTASTSGKAGLRHLLHRFIIWQGRVQWYCFAILGIPALLFLGVLVAVPGALANFRFSALLLYPVSFIGGMFVNPLVEEPGWRGFALPRLQKHDGPVMSSIILAFFWACWHAPLFLTDGYNGARSGFLGTCIPFVFFVLGGIGLTILMTWVFNHTRKSLLIALLIHSALDDFPMRFLFPHITISDSVTLVYVISFDVPALLLLIITRGKLGYQGSATTRYE